MWRDFRPAFRLAGQRALLAFVFMQCADTMLTTGSVRVPGNSTVFIMKFCFTFNTLPLQSAGRLNLTVWAPNLTKHQRAQLVAFDDEAESFPGPSGHWDALSCDQRVRHAKHVIRLDWTKAQVGQLVRFNIREKLRPRFWYLALADCSGTGLDLRYEVHAENPAYSWARELPTDQRHAPLAFAVLAAAYAALTVAQLRANAVLAASAKGDNAADKAAHPFARILTLGIVLGLFASVLSAAHYLRYAQSGSGGEIARVPAQLLSGASHFLLASLLLLISEGKCVSYVMVAADAWRVGRLLGPFVVAGLSLEFWGHYSVSRRYTTDYVYTTAFGWALILLDLFLLGIYIKALRETHATERDRGDGRFYRTWAVFYGLWFLALPVTAVLSQVVLAPYVWYIVSVAVNGAVTVLVYAALVVGLWPGNRRTYFKLTHAPPEDILECAPSPPGRTFSTDSVRPDWLKELPAGGLPKLLGSRASRSQRYDKLGFGIQ